MAQPNREVVVILEEAWAHRDRAEQARQRATAESDAAVRERFAGLAAKLDVQAARLEAHAQRLQSLVNRANRLTADVQSEIAMAQLTILEIEETLSLKPSASVCGTAGSC